MDVLELVELAIGLVFILVAAELFTNGIEWFGHKLNLAEGAVGSVLAAVGTALPETMIPLIALVLIDVNQNFPFGGTSILIMVGVALDTVKQIESQLQQRNYEGFLR